MKKRTIFVLIGVVIVWVIIILALGQKSTEFSAQCQVDSDCVPGGTCCHPTECVNKVYAQTFLNESCKEVACTAMCGPCPDCKCVDNKCTKDGEISVNEGGCC